MQDHIEQYALELLRALREQHPNIFAGAWVDPYMVALYAGMNPDGPYYAQAIDYLVSERALEWAEETRRVVGKPIYRITRRGLEMSGGR
jgi:hypothetical protein